MAGSPIVVMVVVAHFSGSLLRHPNLNKIDKIPEYAGRVAYYKRD